MTPLGGFPSVVTRYSKMRKDEADATVHVHSMLRRRTVEYSIITSKDACFNEPPPRTTTIHLHSRGIVGKDETTAKATDEQMEQTLDHVDERCPRMAPLNAW